LGQVEPLAKASWAASSRRGRPQYSRKDGYARNTEARGGPGEGILQAALVAWLAGMGNEWGFELAPLRHGWMGWDE